MSAYSPIIPLVVASVLQVSPNANGFEWEGGYGVLTIVGGVAGDFQYQAGDGTFIPVDSMASGASLVTAAIGAHPFLLPPGRVRMSAAGAATFAAVQRTG
jgi:hypothetical protein